MNQDLKLCPSQVCFAKNTMVLGSFFTKTSRFNYIQQMQNFLMVRLGMVVVIGGVVISMGVAMVFFLEYQPNVLEAQLGQQITIGPVTYTLSYEGLEKGSKEIESDRMFMKIGILAEDSNGEMITAEKKQFILLDKNRAHTEPTHGIFVEGSPQILAYFPLEEDKLDDEFQYKIMVRPTKEQRSTDLGFVCVTNCEETQ